MTTPHKLFGNLDRRHFVAAAGVALASVAVPLIRLAMPGQSPKKGFCTSVRRNDWLTQINALNAKWFYSWSADIPEGVPQGVDFAPMIWGWNGDKTQLTLDRIKTLKKEGTIKHLMGFNEPDQHDQSNLTVETALNAWPKLMEAGLPLTSPGCVHPDDQWMIEFMNGVDQRKLRVDIVCVHSYGGLNAVHLMERLEKVYKMFQRPIWITEFAVGDWQAKTVRENRHSPKEIAKFMREVLPMLDEAEFVDRYCWRSANPDARALGTSALFDSDDKLTELGEIYRSH